MKIKVPAFAVAVVFLITTSVVFAADRLVPDEYPTIQAAIAAAFDGDTVIVEQDTYYENIDFGGKSITVTSTDPNDPNVVAGTVIDSNGSWTVVTFPDAPGANCVLTGFTITGGRLSNKGGGVYCDRGTISISKCIFIDNIAEDGGGIYNDECHLTVTDCSFNGNTADDGQGGGIYGYEGELTVSNCSFIENSAADEGGGLANDYTSATVTNCIFRGNSATFGGGMHSSHFGATVTNVLFSDNSADEGGGICTKRLYLRELRLINCTFSYNTADVFGGAVSYRYDGDLMVRNCIFWDDSAFEGPEIALQETGTVSVSYSCVQGGEWDVYAPSGVVNWLDGNITDDPDFADARDDDCHLESALGRWDPDTEAWVTDDNNSPCIDAGDGGSDWTEELWPHGKRINMGAFGGTPQASMSASGAGNIADLDRNDVVDGVDLKVLTEKWLYQQLLLSEDLDRNGILNAKDFAVFADNWAWEQ